METEEDDNQCGPPTHRRLLDNEDEKRRKSGLELITLDQQKKLKLIVTDAPKPCRSQTDKNDIHLFDITERDDKSNGSKQ